MRPKLIELLHSANLVRQKDSLDHSRDYDINCKKIERVVAKYLETENYLIETNLANTLFLLSFADENNKLVYNGRKNEAHLARPSLIGGRGNNKLNNSKSFNYSLLTEELEDLLPPLDRKIKFYIESNISGAEKPSRTCYAFVPPGVYKGTNTRPHIFFNDKKKMLINLQDLVYTAKSFSEVTFPWLPKD